MEDYKKLLLFLLILSYIILYKLSETTDKNTIQTLAILVTLFFILCYRYKQAGPISAESYHGLHNLDAPPVEEASAEEVLPAASNPKCMCTLGGEKQCHDGNKTWEKAQSGELTFYNYPNKNTDRYELAPPLF